MPGWAVLEHGVEDDQQLAHARYDGQALGLVGGQQTLVGIPGHGVRLERLSTLRGHCIFKSRAERNNWFVG